MKTSQLHFISPHIARPSQSAAELFGAMTWLWMQSETHRKCPLFDLERLLMPALQTGQFVLALDNSTNQSPVGLYTWANLNLERESIYLRTLDRTLKPSDWQCGDRPWVLDMVAPFGHAYAMARQSLRHLQRSYFRALYHKGDLTGLRVLHFRSSDTTRQQEIDFWASKPIDANNIANAEQTKQP